MQEIKTTARSLMQFLDKSPVNFYAVSTIVSTLESHGYTRLDPARSWDVSPGGRYYMVKNDSAVFAVHVGTGSPADGFRIIAAHSDSPTFRIKPHPEMYTDGGLIKLNVEVYGGPIFYTWFDRPLSIAGRVVVRGEDPLHPVSRLVRFDRPLLTIPHLAIHFNRNVNDGNHLSAQKDMLPVIGFVTDRMEADGLLMRMVADALGCRQEDILDFDLSLYDTTPACLVGMNDDFISSGRLDDLSMVHAALEALMASDATDCDSTRVMAIFDNEETGSGTKQGAASPVLATMLRRIVSSLGGSDEDFYRAIAESFMISADNAHAYHPNYGEKYDPTNHPVPGGGPVIKFNARCKYMTDAESAAVFHALCEKAGVPCQTFVNHSDVAGGSTLGNILTSQMDLRGVDMGNALWAMHSVRETGSTADQWYTTRVFNEFFS